jgi:hypothetical protein
MADLVSLKRTDAEKKEERAEMEAPYSGEDYSYGLRLSLCDEEMEKLGMDKPTMGGEMLMLCKVKVVGYSEGASERHKHRSVELQVTEAAVRPDANRVSDAEALYGRK